MNRIDAILFDIDGTLIHTPESYIHSVVRDALVSLGKTCTLDEAKAIHFRGDRDDYVARVLGVDINDFWRAFQANDPIEARARAIKLYLDSKVLRVLREAGLKLGLVTGAPRPWADLNIETIRRNYHIDDAVVANPLEGVEPKPHPWGIYECLRRLGVSPEHACYVGNGDEDRDASRNASVRHIHVCREDECHLEAHDGHETINSLDALPALLGL